MTARPETIDQYPRDVAAFLMWAAEPHLETRKQTGFVVMIFLALFGGLVYLTKAQGMVIRPALMRPSADTKRAPDRRPFLFVPL